METHRWRDIRDIEQFQNGRSIVAEALQANLRDIVQNKVPYGNVLEVGFGMGALADRLPAQSWFTLPGRKRKMFYLDSSEPYAQVMQDKYPKANIVVSDADKLAIASESMHGVVSLSAYDTFRNLPGALQETLRILKSGGTFVHILDLGPDPFPLAIDAHSRGEVFLPSLPVVAPHFLELALRVAKEKEVKEFMKRKLGSLELRKALGYYMQNYSPNLSAAVTPEQMSWLAQQLEGIKSLGRQQPLSHIFALNMKRLMDEVGFADTQIATHTYGKIVKRRAIHDEEEARYRDPLTREVTHKNVFINCIGSRDTAFDRRLPPDLVRVFSVVQCITGRKP